ncbi:MAG: hypothetical protein K8T20_12780 [Planctomycetes bacterium]|nr:hypothetical protein [Planctomycetota bacterium]
MADKKLHVTCSCGQTLAFRPEQAGGRFRCPACKEPLDLTEATGEETAPPAVRSAPGRGVAPKPGSGAVSRGRRPAAGPPAEEEEAPVRSRSGLASRGRGAQAPAPVAEAAEVSPEAARKKKMVLAGGIGGALVLVIVVAGILAFKGPGKPENAGRTSEGTEIWKTLETDFKAAENKDDPASRDTAFKKVLDSIEASRKLHNYGWPDFFKGRALSRMGKYDEAREALVLAIGKLEKTAQNYAKIERGLIASRQSLERLLRTRRFRAGGVSLSPDPVSEETGKAATADLRLADSAKETPFFSVGLLALAQAEADRIDGRPSEALRKFETAISGRAQAGYAQAASGGLYYETDKWEYGSKAMDAAIEADHGSGFARLSAAWGLRRRALLDMANAEAPAWLDRAVDFADKAASEGHPAAFAAAACLRLDRATLRIEKGEDAKAILDEADTKATEALGKDASDPSAQEIQAVVAFRRAEIDERAGKDPRPGLDRAIASLDRLAGDPKDIPAIMNRARALLKRARAESSRGADSRSFYDRAARDFDAVRGNDGPGGGTIEPILGSATARVEKAIEDSKKGTDTNAIFQKVIDEMSSLIRSRPNLIAALEARGLAQWALSEALTRQGKDGSEVLSKALDDLFDLFSKQPSLRVGGILVDAWLAKGEANIKAGIDPRQAFENASNNVDACLKLSPGNLDLQMRRGKALTHSAEYSLKMKLDPSAQLTTAVNDFTAILAAQADNPEARFERGRALLMLSRAEYSKGQDARINVTNAITDLEALVAKDPKNARGFYTCGDAILFMGWVDFGRGNDALDTLARAVGKMDAATKLDDKNGEFWNGLGNALFVTIQASRKAAKVYGPALDQAEAAYRKALALEHWQAQINLGMIFAYQLKFDEAEQAWTEASAKCPDKKDEIARNRGWLREFRERLKDPWRGS